ncbi:ANTAR domain-containing protein [Streptomyces beijiangensis]|uniref:ANTAR domain-containing protein n=1 Tax=Streptomyces beijiangensis TaxID=163361 RepID=A0A939FB61_9ACTN|nr:ANTAR domain-containing protein [Streptomyces beijiangensis]MBO0515377.1 ANTAR domain-containing protein [Streptomyces beijiangensis]
MNEQLLAKTFVELADNLVADFDLIDFLRLLTDRCVTMLQQRSTRRSTVLNEQLQAALDSRVLIEQAKGKFAERRGTDMEQAFSALRGYARSHNRRLSDVARDFIDGSEPLDGLGV